MKWLLRTTIALGLLACLGYASYAFGMYVLSKKLFGDTVLQNSVNDASSHSATVTKSVTRKNRDKNAPGGAEVNVLDARDAGPGPEAPSLDTLERETRARDYDAPSSPSRQRIVTAESLKTIAPKTDSADGTSDENRPRRRRRRRRRSTSETTTTTSTTARNDTATTPDSASSGDASTRETTSASTSSSSRDLSSSSSERPRHRRESNSDSGSAPRREKRIESPVPGGGAKSDGGSSGSDSPVPVPE